MRLKNFQHTLAPTGTQIYFPFLRVTIVWYVKNARIRTKLWILDRNYNLLIVFPQITLKK